jgi:deazaflavin-dependent oxidoreductase (nitroreductase family)
MSDMNNWNQQVIKEFRESAGKMGGMFANAKMMLLHTKGAKTGQDRMTPVVYQQVGPTSYAIFASKGGAPTNPDWYHNLRANPEATAELGTETVKVRARVTEGEERDRIWTRQTQQAPGFAEYASKTTRQIPVLILERAS